MENDISTFSKLVVAKLPIGNNIDESSLPTRKHPPIIHFHDNILMVIQLHNTPHFHHYFLVKEKLTKFYPLIPSWPLLVNAWPFNPLWSLTFYDVHDIFSIDFSLKHHLSSLHIWNNPFNSSMGNDKKLYLASSRYKFFCLVLTS